MEKEEEESGRGTAASQHDLDDSRCQFLVTLPPLSRLRTPKVTVLHLVSL